MNVPLTPPIAEEADDRKFDRFLLRRIVYRSLQLKMSEIEFTIRFVLSVTNGSWNGRPWTVVNVSKSRWSLARLLSAKPLGNSGRSSREAKLLSLHRNTRTASDHLVTLIKEAGIIASTTVRTDFVRYSVLQHYAAMPNISQHFHVGRGLRASARRISVVTVAQ